MSVWSYDGVVRVRDSIYTAVRSYSCVFCGERLSLLKTDSNHINGTPDYWDGIPRNSTDAYTCSQCGWWRIGRSNSIDYGNVRTSEWFGATGSLLELDLSDQSVPITEAVGYLSRHYGQRGTIDPIMFEQVVASVYRNLGFQAKATNRSGDQGIDVILEDSSGTMIGVQVKRSKNRIKAEPIRSLAGALLINGLTSGIFITTGSFQPGADEAARLATLRGTPIELVDGDAFLSALELSQRNVLERLADPTAPYFNVPLMRLGTEKSGIGVAHKWHPFITEDDKGKSRDGWNSGRGPEKN